MRAAVNRHYGGPDVVEIVDDEAIPTPRTGQLQVRVASSAVTAADARIRAASFPRGFGLPGRLAFGLRRPRRRILGSTFAGTVTAVGAGVTDVTVGQRVCGMAGVKFGAHAEYLAVDRKRCVPIPDGVDDDQAAGVLFGGTTALHFLDLAGTTAGHEVLVVGGAGAVGSNAVQLAKLRGAVVTAVTGPTNLQLARDLGADRVIDRSTTDVTALTERFDLVMDTVGALSPATGRPLLTRDGRLQLLVASLGQLVLARGQVQAGTSAERPAAFEHLLSLVAAGSLRVVIDRVVDLDGIVEAHRRVDTGHKIGNILVHP